MEKTPAKVGFLAGLVTLWKTHARSVCSQRTEPHAGAVCGELQPGGKTHTGVVNEGLYLVGHHARAGEDREEEQQRNICDEVDTSLFPIPLCYLWEGDRRARSKVQPGKKRGGGRVVLVGFISHDPTRY